MYLDYSDPNNIADIVTAIRNGDLEMLRFALKDGADPDMRDKGGLGLLHIAVKENKAEAVDILIAAHADPNLPVAMTNHTPLFYAAHPGVSPGIVDALIRCGARTEAVDAYGWTPLHMAADHGAHEAVQALIAAGADVQARDRDGRTPYDIALKHFEQIRQDSHLLCCQHLRAAERALDVEGLKHEKAERDIAALKGHNPKRFRLKF
jgi:ankyrin repeat protein